MSETSLSSSGFIRSVANLPQSDPRPLSVDVDEIFASGDVRKKLAKKLIGKARPAVSVVTTVPERAFSSPLHTPSSASEEGESSTKSTTSILSSPTQTAPVQSVYTSTDFSPWNVFINCVDTFNCKYIAHFLSEQKYLSTRPPKAEKEEEEEEEEEEEVELEGEEEEEDDAKKKIANEKRKSTKQEIPETNYVIFGSLLEPDGKYDGESVVEAVRTSDIGRMSEIIRACGFVVYDISRYPSQIEEAQWALHSLESYLERLETQNPEAFKESKEVRTFILISTFMTWARTKFSSEDPDAFFRETDFKRRRCHPNFKKHFLLEKEVLTLRKKWPEKLKTLVLCSGVQYGYEEDILNFIFKLAWENEPAIPLYTNGKNYIPLIHVHDLAMMVFHILEKLPKLRYLLAVEQNFSTLKSITKSISKGLSTGDIIKLPKEDMQLLTDISKPIFDSLTANVRMEPSYFLHKDKIDWRTDTSFAYNITKVIDEYRKSRRLTAKRILIVGPPASGRTTLSKKLCGYYRLHYLSPETIVERSIETLKYKIERIMAKEKSAELYKTGEEEESEEEEESTVEEEEEITESIEELTETLNELEHNLEENKGHVDVKHLIKCLRTMITSSPLRNQGYVLDGFPETVEQLKKVFSGTGDEEEEEYVEEEEDDQIIGASVYPDYVVSLEASDNFILDIVMALPEETIQSSKYDEESIKKRLVKYRFFNNDDTGLLNYLDEREIHPILIDVESDTSSQLEDSFNILVERIGEPHNFGLSPEQLQEENILLELKTKWEEEKQKAEKEEREKREHEERMRRVEQWAKVMSSLGDEGEEIHTANSLPLRHYLMKYVLPTLTRGLIEVSRVRPVDPLDHLAEFLFRENKEGRPFEPEHALESRKIFEEMHKCGETLFSLAILTEKEKEVFFPSDVTKAAEDTELEWDTYY